MKSVAIMQPYFLPYIGYWQLMYAVDEFVIFDDVNFIKKGWINRNNMWSANGPLLFTLPLVGASQNKKINELELANDNPWREKLLKTITQNYKKTAYFEQVFPIAEQIINCPQRQLKPYIQNSFEIINKYLGINTRLIDSSSQFNNDHLEAESRIIDICKQLHADMYINPIGGTALYHKEHFASAQVQLQFIETQKISYQQPSKNFIPYLSILDLLMNCSTAEIESMLQQYALI